MVERAWTRGGGFSDTFITFLHDVSAQQIITLHYIPIDKVPNIIVLHFKILHNITFLQEDSGQQIITMAEAQLRVFNLKLQSHSHRVLNLRGNYGRGGKLQCCKFFGMLPHPLVVTQSVTNRQFCLFHLLSVLCALYLLLSCGLVCSPGYQFTWFTQVALPSPYSRASLSRFTGN